MENLDQVNSFLRGMKLLSDGVLESTRMHSAAVETNQELLSFDFGLFLDHFRAEKRASSLDLVKIKAGKVT